jgi:hypothetical protein
MQYEAATITAILTIHQTRFIGWSSFVLVRVVTSEASKNFHRPERAEGFASGCPAQPHTH